MRNRTIQLNIRLTENEYDKVIRNSKKSNLTVSGYIRMLMGGYVPKEAPPIEFHEIMSQLTALNSKLTSGNEVEHMELCGIILRLQEVITQPERIECME